MTPRYIDAHCHIQFEQFDDDRNSVIEKMKEKEVSAIVIGCDFKSSELAVTLAQEHSNLYSAIALHPNHDSSEQYNSSAYVTLANNSKVIAIGECGLDYFRPESVTDVVKEKQKSLFKEHINLAKKLDKPLIIHARPSKGTVDAYKDIIVLLKDAKKMYPELRGDIHFFVGGVDEARELISLGFTISFTAVITFTNDYDDVIRTVPIENILAETDSPYVAPKANRGKRNNPLAVIDVVERIAEIRGEDIGTVRKTILANTNRLFSLGRHLDVRRPSDTSK